MVSVCATSHPKYSEGTLYDFTDADFVRSRNLFVGSRRTGSDVVAADFGPGLLSVCAVGVAHRVPVHAANSLLLICARGRGVVLCCGGHVASRSLAKESLSQFAQRWAGNPQVVKPFRLRRYSYSRPGNATACVSAVRLKAGLAERLSNGLLGFLLRIL